MVEDSFGPRCRRITRYAIREEAVFDRGRLEMFSRRLPEGYGILPIGPELYDQCIKNPELRDLCSLFDSAGDYEARGLGYCATYGGEAVCGASSYSVYDGGIEIEVDTMRAHRRRGLATACAAQLILACLDRDLVPSWDAANLESVALAEKLGYRLSHSYTAYAVEG